LSPAHKIRTVFFATALVLTAMFLLFAKTQQMKIEVDRRLAQTEDVLAQLASMRAFALETEIAVRGYLVGGDHRYLDAYHSSQAALDARLETVEKLTADNTKQVMRIARLRDATHAGTEASIASIQLRDQKGADESIRAFKNHDPSRDLDIEKILAEMSAAERTLLIDRVAHLKASALKMFWVLSALGAFVPLLLMTGYVVLQRDASHRKSLERQLMQTNSELEIASRVKSEFLASMSHELHTPLNAIIGFTGTVLMRLAGPLTADQEKQLKVVQSSARHLVSLINDLLDVTKIESGKVEIKLEALPCQEIIEQVVATLQPLAQAKDIRLGMTLPTSHVLARTDRRALSQILINLGDNAIKFTDAGWVTMALSEQNELAAVAVIDTGIGVLPADQPRLFRAFSQLSSGKESQGTGLGLYISGKLAALIGGRIEIQSQYGKGSRFTVLLPKA